MPSLPIFLEKTLKLFNPFNGNVELVVRNTCVPRSRSGRVRRTEAQVGVGDAGVTTSLFCAAAGTLG
jgi:hypothetical protein